MAKLHASRVAAVLGAGAVIVSGSLFIDRVEARSRGGVVGGVVGGVTGTVGGITGGVVGTVGGVTGGVTGTLSNVTQGITKNGPNGMEPNGASFRGQGFFSGAAFKNHNATHPRNRAVPVSRPPARAITKSAPPKNTPSVVTRSKKGNQRAQQPFLSGNLLNRKGLTANIPLGRNQDAITTNIIPRNAFDRKKSPVVALTGNLGNQGTPAVADRNAFLTSIALGLFNGPNSSVANQNSTGGLTSTNIALLNGPNSKTGQ